MAVAGKTRRGKTKGPRGVGTEEAAVATPDELDAVPPAAFVRTRDALVARLRKTGRTREAAEVARRRRPSLVLWLVNGLARTDPAGVRRLVDDTDRLRRAQLRDPRAIPEATTRHRAALQHLMQQAEQSLGDAGIRPAPDVLRRVHATLGAAATDRRTRTTLRQGRLTEEIAPGGFDVLGGTPSPHLTLVKSDRVARPAETVPAERPDTRERKAAERQARQAAEREAKVQRRQAAKAKSEATRRQRAIDQATGQAERLRTRLRTLEERIERERRTSD